MSPEDLVDPELRPLLAKLPRAHLSAHILPAARAGVHEMASRMCSPPTSVQVEECRVPGPAGSPDVRLRIYRPIRAGSAIPAILHFHGGGYVLGLPEMNETSQRQLASELHCAIVSVDYRLAPETTFPGQVEDAYAALVWLAVNATQLGIDATRIGVKGESAGGGLAAGLALLSRDRGGPALAFQHLIYPMLDDRTCVDPQPNPFTGNFVWTRESNRFGWSSLLGALPGVSDVSSYAAPARAQDLRNLPATFISVGSLDLFFDENLAYARRLCRAGVAVELHVYPGAVHRFYEATTARVTRSAQRDSIEALRRSLS
jgi:triacylglycerol lipase